MRSFGSLSVLLLALMISSCGREESRPPTSPGNQVVAQDEDSGIARPLGNNCPTALPMAVVVGTIAPSQTIQLEGSDPDGDALQYFIVQPPGHGTAVLGASGLVTFTPVPGYCGPDFFSYSVSDGQCPSSTAPVILKINCCPDDDDQVLNTDKNTAVPFQVSATDANGDDLVYSVSDEPSHGTLIFDPVSLEGLYTPATNYCGPDYFTIQVYDGSCHHNIFIDIVVCAVLDGDGDDVPDDQDDCPVSDLQQTIWLDGCDTGVPNQIGGAVVGASGCSLADLVHQAVSDAQGGASNHGQLISTLQKQINRLTRLGLLPPGASGAIMSCAAQIRIHS